MTSVTWLQHTPQFIELGPFDFMKLHVSEVDVLIYRLNLVMSAPAQTLHYYPVTVQTPIAAESS